MNVEHRADELAAAFQRAAKELRADGDHTAAELADELCTRAFEAVRNPAAKRAQDHDDRTTEILDHAG